MSVTYTEKAKQLLSESELAFADATTKELLSKYMFPPVDATWDATEDPAGHTMFTLEAKDPEQTARRVLEPDAVRSKHRLRFHLFQLMGELLRQRSDKSIRERLQRWETDGPEN